jgi:hypothetical protein
VVGGGEIKDLRRRLRATPKTEVADTFPPYGDAFRRRFGIANPQALDLFHQTVSMKSVGDLSHLRFRRTSGTYADQPQVDPRGTRNRAARRRAWPARR